MSYEDREDAGWRLAERLKSLPLKDPLVLAIPRGGIEVGLPIARALGAELDVVLSRKLRAPRQPELALGAVSETGEVYLNRHAEGMTEAGDGVVERECREQMAEIARRGTMFRAVRPRAAVEGRSVIVTDDGIATGSTMIAALRTVRGQRPHELIVAVPVAPEDRLAEVRALCDRLVCPCVPETFWAVGQFYREFGEVSDERVVEVLREHHRHRSAGMKRGGRGISGAG
ncbi:MAG: phosphoribosyltransferase [Phycisphaerales bacterium]|nr:phosphoribosyltransferase [Phycisphaerales bacterium]